MDRRPLGLELALVVVVALAVLLPGLRNYSLVDPWETHYGEVARVMLRDHDFVHLDWPGTNFNGDPNEGFRSKPVLSFWLMAASMRAAGLVDHGGYSGEMAHDARTMLAIRLPFVLCAVLGLTLVWWMLARLVSRRLAWLALLVIGTTPLFCFIARQAIPDMPLCATVMGAIAMFVMAVEDGDRPISTLFAFRRFAIDGRHIMLAVCGGFVVVQAIYYAAYFAVGPPLAVRVPVSPALALPLLALLLLAGTSSTVWRVARLPLFYPTRVLVFPFVRSWPRTASVADRLLRVRRIDSMRQVYLMWCYALLGVSILAKGPPGVTLVGVVGIFYVLLLGRWRELYDGYFELKRGVLLAVAIFLPWHIGMWLREGSRFVNEYLLFHILNRATADPDKSVGTFGFYATQLGHGMWLWAALVPAALAATLLRTRLDARAARVRFVIALWAITGFALFAFVETKFNHYILPAVPALGILVAFFLDDILARRDRLHPLLAAVGVGIVLLITRDLVWEPERWIEMFTYRYDRPWSASIDLSDGFLILGLVAAIALVCAALSWRRLGVGALCLAGLSICLWSLHVYMPIAGRHWGSRDAIRTYYEQRVIYGQKLVYYSARQLADDWRDAGTHWTFETFVPYTMYLGRPMTLTVKLADTEVRLAGTVSRIGDHDIEVELPTVERAKLDPLIVRGQATPATRVQRPIRAVEADRLIAYQLYWRGDQFWSGGEIWDALPEMKTTFAKDANATFLAYLGDRSRAPVGRRYFVISDAAYAKSVRGLLPTERAKGSFEVANTDSNKFTLISFVL